MLIPSRPSTKLERIYLYKGILYMYIWVHSMNMYICKEIETFRRVDEGMRGSNYHLLLLRSFFFRENSWYSFRITFYFYFVRHVAGILATNESIFLLSFHHPRDARVKISHRKITLFRSGFLTPFELTATPPSYLSALERGYVYHFRVGNR